MKATSFELQWLCLFCLVLSCASKGSWISSLKGGLVQPPDFEKYEEVRVEQTLQDERHEKRALLETNIQLKRMAESLMSSVQNLKKEMGRLQFVHKKELVTLATNHKAKLEGALTDFANEHKSEAGILLNNLQKKYEAENNELREKLLANKAQLKETVRMAKESNQRTQNDITNLNEELCASRTKLTDQMERERLLKEERFKLEQEIALLAESLALAGKQVVEVEVHTSTEPDSTSNGDADTASIPLFSESSQCTQGTRILSSEQPNELQPNLLELTDNHGNQQQEPYRKEEQPSLSDSLTHSTVPASAPPTDLWQTSNLENASGQSSGHKKARKYTSRARRSHSVSSPTSDLRQR